MVFLPIYMFYFEKREEGKERKRSGGRKRDGEMWRDVEKGESIKMTISKITVLSIRRLP